MCASRQSGIAGYLCDLIDLQTLVPWDREAVVTSIQKTGRCVIVHEAPKTSGFGAEMAQFLFRRGAFGALESPNREGDWMDTFPHTTEWDYMPGPDKWPLAIAKTQED